MNLLWSIIWLVVMFGLIFGAYIYSEKGIEKTMNTLKVKMDLRDGQAHPDTWTLTVSDDGNVVSDSRNQLTGSNSPEVETIRKKALLGKITGDIEINDVLYVYSAERIDTTNTTIQFVSYDDI